MCRAILSAHAGSKLFLLHVIKPSTVLILFGHNMFVRFSFA